MMKFRGLNKLQSKVLLGLIIFILPVITCKAQSNVPSVDSLAAKIEFEQDTIDYGIVPLKSNPYRYINFKNAGKEPLIISVFGDVATPVEYPTTPIQPGQNAKIKIYYPTTRPGPFNCIVGINSNAIPHQQIVLIKGWVLSSDGKTK